MNINQDFGIALHMLTYLAINDDNYITSRELADSINTNPVIIRQILPRLNKHNLVITKRGRAGSKLAKPSKEISLYEVYQALYNEDYLSSKHEPNKNCPIGQAMCGSISQILHFINIDVDNSLKNYYIADIKNIIKKEIRWWK